MRRRVSAAADRAPAGYQPLRAGRLREDGAMAAEPRANQAAGAEVVAEHLSKTYPGGVRAVVDVSLRIGAGELVVLTGPSGCGKSTLLNLIGRARPPRRRRAARRRALAGRAALPLRLPPAHGRLRLPGVAHILLVVAVVALIAQVVELTTGRFGRACGWFRGVVAFACILNVLLVFGDRLFVTGNPAGLLGQYYEVPSTGSPRLEESLRRHRARSMFPSTRRERRSTRAVPRRLVHRRQRHAACRRAGVNASGQ